MVLEMKAGIRSSRWLEGTLIAIYQIVLIIIKGIYKREILRSSYFGDRIFIMLNQGGVNG